MGNSERDPDDSGDRGATAPTPQAGVLGNLPKKRPAVRSPRRPGAEAKVEAQASAAQPRRSGSKSQPPPAPRAPERDADEEPEHSTAADLEGIARGGIAIAGGAASLGLRIAGRAAAALRDAVERR